MSTASRSIARAYDMPAALAVTCVRATWRAVLAALVLASRASVLLVLARVVLADDPPITPPTAALMTLAMVLLPAALAALLARGFAATVTVEGDRVVVTRTDVRLEIPASAIVAVVPWRVPVPGPGAALMLRSGRFGWGFALDRPRELATFLTTRAGVALDADTDDPAFAYADARGAAGRLDWQRWLLKFPVLGLAPTAVLFNAHQHIAYGGTWGEWYLLGAGAYAADFAVHWLTVTIYLALWAGCWRIAAEIVAWLAARLAPATAAGVRRALEIGCRVLYYGGVPLLLALRFAS